MIIDPPAALFHVRDHRHAETPWRPDIGAHQKFVSLIVGLDQVIKTHHPGIVHQNIDTAEPVEGRFYQTLYLGLVGDIAGQGKDFIFRCPDRGGCLLEFFNSSAADYDLSAFFHKGEGNLSADSCSAACYYCYFSV